MELYVQLSTVVIEISTVVQQSRLSASSNRVNYAGSKSRFTDLDLQWRSVIWVENLSYVLRKTYTNSASLLWFGQHYTISRGDYSWHFKV